MNLAYALGELLIWFLAKATLLAFVVLTVFITVRLLEKYGVPVFKRRFIGGFVAVIVVLFLLMPNMASKISEIYFDKLCKEESGLFVYKTVEDVNGVFMLRPRKNVTDKMLKDRYMLDPIGHEGPPMGNKGISFISNVSKFLGLNGYLFVEMAIEDEARLEDTPLNIKRYDFSMFDKPELDDKYVQYCCAGKELNSLVKTYSPNRKSRYGYTWKDIFHRYDRELGIAGSELIVKDLESDEILGLLRSFVRSQDSGFSDDGFIFVPVNWSGPTCPEVVGYAFDFKTVSKILQPSLEIKENQGVGYE
jgi:hypothetical protein